MLTSLNRMTGLPVVWRDRQVGYVERAVADVRRMRLHGIVIRKGIGGARWSPAEGILLAGRTSIVISRTAVRTPDAEPEPISHTVLPGGRFAGEVSDVFIRTDTLRIAAFEVSQGPFYRLAGQCSYAPCGWLSRQEPGMVVVPHLLSWTQLLAQLGEGDDT